MHKFLLIIFYFSFSGQHDARCTIPKYLLFFGGNHDARRTTPQIKKKKTLSSTPNTFSTQVARKGLRKAILDALGSILGPPEGRFWRFFGGFPLEWADSLEAEATFEKPAKTTVKPMVFTRFSHVRPCAHNAKI